MSGGLTSGQSAPKYALSTTLRMRRETVKSVDPAGENSSVTCLWLWGLRVLGMPTEHPNGATRWDRPVTVLENTNTPDGSLCDGSERKPVFDVGTYLFLKSRQDEKSHRVGIVPIFLVFGNVEAEEHTIILLTV